jgi:hypothetical protein
LHAGSLDLDTEGPAGIEHIVLQLGQSAEKVEAKVRLSWHLNDGSDAG